MGLTVAACAPKAEQPAEGTEEGETEAVEQAAPKAKDFKSSKSQIDSVSYLLGVNFGSIIKGYNFGDMNYSQILKGLKDMAGSKGKYTDPDFTEQFKINPETMNMVINEYLQKHSRYISLSNKEKSEEFLDRNGRKPGVVTTPSGLQYVIVAPGNPEVKAGITDTVEVFYKGTTIDGIVFDETPEDGEPAKFPLNRNISGWQEGLQLIGEGGEMTLYIPSELAYGENGPQEIGPNQTLIFDVKLVRVGKYVAPEQPAEPAK